MFVSKTPKLRQKTVLCSRVSVKGSLREMNSKCLNRRLLVILGPKDYIQPYLNLADAIIFCTRSNIQVFHINRYLFRTGIIEKNE